MVFIIFDFTEHVEEEDAHILMQVLVVQEQLRQEGQVLAINRILIAINLKHSHCIFLIPVNLISRWMKKGTTFAMSFEFNFEREEAETEVADV